MNTKFLFIIAMSFFFAWKKLTEPFLLFCALFATALWVCVFIYRMENPYQTVNKDNE